MWKTRFEFAHQDQPGRKEEADFNFLPPFLYGGKKEKFLLNVYAKAFLHAEKYSSFLSPWKYRRPHIVSIPIVQRVTSRLAREIIPFVVELKGHSWENTSQANIHGENNERTREIYEGGREGNTLLCIIGPFIPSSPPPRNSMDTHSAVCMWYVPLANKQRREGGQRIERPLQTAALKSCGAFGVELAVFLVGKNVFGHAFFRIFWENNTRRSRWQKRENDVLSPWYSATFSFANNPPSPL